MRKITDVFPVFQHKNYTLFWIGSVISIFGSQMQLVGVSWHVYSLTHSAFYLGLIGFSGFLPIMILSPFGGILVDALNRKKLLLIIQITLGIIALLLTIMTATNTISPLLIFGILFLMGVVTVVDIPARHSIIPSLVPTEKTVSGYAFLTIGRQIITLIGPMLAGFIIAGFGVEMVYMVNAISFFVLFIMLCFVEIPDHLKEKAVPMNLSSVKEGIAYVFHSPILLSAMLLDFFANFFAASTVIFPIFAAEILHIGTTGLGFLYAAPAIGGVITGIIFGAMKIKNHGKLLIYSVIIYSLATIGFGLSTDIWISLFFLAISGGADIVSVIVRRAVTQLVTPEYIRGRMNSINSLFFTGGPYLGEAEAGFAAGLMGAPLSVVLGGIAACLSVLGISYFVPELRKYSMK